MSVEIGGIKIQDSAQALYYEALGFISEDELNEAIRGLDKADGTFLLGLVELQERNLKKPFLKTILDKLHLTKRQ